NGAGKGQHTTPAVSPQSSAGSTWSRHGSTAPQPASNPVGNQAAPSPQPQNASNPQPTPVIAITPPQTPLTPPPPVPAVGGMGGGTDDPAGTASSGQSAGDALGTVLQDATSATPVLGADLLLK
ncbi:MAG: hypothetical protein JWR85_3853, partial [Marmoricola sp.]|nr:hypothetical protein [Marmoricola sp.]